MSVITEKSQDPQDPILTFKVVVLGDSGVGKTCFLKRWRTGEFEKSHIPTLGVEVHPLTFHTSHGVFRFNMWDVAGKPEYAGLGNGYTIEASAAIVMVDLTRPETVASKYLGKLSHLVRTVVCGNKYDVAGRDPCAGHDVFFRNLNVPYYDISAKSNYNFEKPFQTLLRALTGHEHLVFIESPAVVPPEVPLPFTDEQENLALAIKKGFSDTEGFFDLDWVQEDIPESMLERYRDKCEKISLALLLQLPVETLRKIRDKHCK